MNPVSADIRDKIAELVGHGVDTIGETRRQLRLFIETQLFKDRPLPALTDTAYYPLDDTIRKHMYLA